MRNFLRNFLGGVATICLVATMIGMVSGATINGPLTFETGDQGGPYTPFGPDACTITVTFPGAPGDMALNLDPTVNGNGMVFDTGFSTGLSSYTVSSDGEWSSGTCYKISCFESGDQVSGDGTSDLNFGNPHSLTMDIVDTGDNATSTFNYTWEQAGNTWVISKTFADIRTCAVGEAIDKDKGAIVIAHVGDLFDDLVKAARDGSDTVSFGYQAFSGTDTITWDNTTVTAVPEPSSLILLISSSLVAIVLVRRKRR